MTDCPTRKESAENRFPKLTSAFVLSGTAHFHAQKMGKLQPHLQNNAILSKTAKRIRCPSADTSDPAKVTARVGVPTNLMRPR
jgi:hypothetical protein